MNELYKPVDNQKGNPPNGLSYPWVSSQPIEKDKGQEDVSQGEALGSQPFLLATCLFYFKKLLDSLFSPPPPLWEEREGLFSALTEFQRTLQKLADEDLSNQAAFIQQIAELWHNLLDHCKEEKQLQIEASTRSRLHHLLEKISFFPAPEIPPSEGYYLGYYLAEYRREGLATSGVWLPFPFMELLSQLHKEYQQRHEGCSGQEITRKDALSLWLKEIEEILFLLKE